MYPVAKGEKEYAGEVHTAYRLTNGKILQQKSVKVSATIPKNRQILTVLSKTTFPKLYGETIFGEFLLSPCNKKNYSLYRYKFARLTGRRIEIVFKPKYHNVQLISGKAIIDETDGRIISIVFRGEMDMVKFEAKMIMSNRRGRGFLPKRCSINSMFTFAGNKVLAHYDNVYHQETTDMKRYKKTAENYQEATETKKYAHIVDDSILHSKIPAATRMVIDSIFMHKWLRESTLILSNEELDNTSIEKKIRNKKNTKLVKMLGDYFVERINGSFGNEAKGSYRISPIINPLYLGYSNNKGVTYRMRLNGSYRFSDKRQISMIVNAGYSFKQQQFYTNIPVRFNFNRETYVETEFGTGNRITNSEILESIKDEKYDSIRWDKMNLDYFKDLYWRVGMNIGVGKNLSIKPGIVYHKRSAVHKEGFILSGHQYVFYSFAPTLQIRFQPWKERDMILTVDYERGLNGILKSNMNYERIENNLSWKKAIHKVNVVSLKAGYGKYTSRSKGAYFLDYANFRYESIPGGWNDDWTGEFQLLNSNWYNASDFYIRSNITYESPIMAIGRLPIVGKTIEMERLYTNLLFTDKLCPYIEYGYGFTNKFFSVGLFCSVSNRQIDGVGMRFGLELFRDW